MFVLEGFPRCGSTTLTHLLNLHPDLNISMEPFHPTRYQGTFHRLANEKGASEAMRILRRRWNGLKHIWEPQNSWPFIGDPQLTGDLFLNASKLITLRRRNLLRQIVSGHISRSLTFWVGTKTEFRQRLATQRVPSLTSTIVVDLLEKAKAAERLRQTWLARRESRVLELFYEDMFESGDVLSRGTEVCQTIFQYLEVDRLDQTAFSRDAAFYLSADRFKWADRTVYLSIPGIEEIDEMCGNPENGYLLR